MEIDNVTVTTILGAALAISECLSLIPAVKANGIFQLIVNVLTTLTGKKSS